MEVKSGWLVKTPPGANVFGFRFARSRRRWFVLFDNGTLAYQETQSSAKPKGTIDLRGVERVDVNSTLITLRPTAPWDRVWRLSTQTEQDAADWMSAITPFLPVIQVRSSTVPRHNVTDALAPSPPASPASANLDVSTASLSQTSTLAPPAVSVNANHRQQMNTKQKQQQQQMHSALLATSAQEGARGRMPGRWENLRFFVSSTFVDTQSERDVLVKEVFPEINQQLKSRWVRCSPVDLRWGVSAAETSVIQQTCLNEIDRCRSGSDNLPWFIALRGERYGWVQTRYDSAEQFHQPENFTWLANVVESGKHLSITSLEVIHAFLHRFSQQQVITEGSENQRPAFPHAFAYFRDPSFIAKCPAEFQWMFSFDFVPPGHGDPNLIASENYLDYQTDLNELNSQIRAATDFCLSRDFSCEYSSAIITGQNANGRSFGCGYTKGLDDFRRMCLEDLWTAISKECPAFTTTPDPLVVERITHEDNINSRSSNFLGRHDLLQKMFDFCDNPKSPGPLVVHGLPGAGKSALIARFCQLFQRRIQNNPGEEILCLQHIVGASPSSVSLRAMLKRLCQEIKEAFDLDLPIPEDPQELVMDAWPAFVRAGCRFKKIVLIIDAVNQLSAQDYAHMMRWVFEDKDCFKRFRFVLSTLDHQCLHSLRARTPRPMEIEVQPLSLDERKDIVREYLAQFHKSLSEDANDPVLGDQLSLLMAKHRADSPLYLIAASERLRTFGVYEEMTTYIDKQLPGTIPDLFSHILEETERIHGQELVSTATSVIYCAKGGMSEVEMIECLSGVSWDSVQVSNFSRYYGGMTTFLSTGGGGNLQFFHQQLQFVVEDRYQLHEGSANWKRTHTVLANYFKEVVDNKRSNYERGLMCLPYHLMHATKFSELRDLMCDLRFIEEKCKSDMTYDLVEDFMLIVTHPELPRESEWEGARDLSEFYRLVKLEGPFLQKRPHLVFQVARNQPDNTAPSLAAQKIEHLHAQPWVRWMNKPKSADSQIMKLVGHQDATIVCAFSEDMQYIVSASKDMTLRAWHAITGAEVNRITLGFRDDIPKALFPLPVLNLDELEDSTVHTFCLVLENHDSIFVCDAVKGVVLKTARHGQAKCHCATATKNGVFVAVAGTSGVTVLKQKEKGDFVCVMRFPLLAPVLGNNPFAVNSYGNTNAYGTTPVISSVDMNEDVSCIVCDDIVGRVGVWNGNLSTVEKEKAKDLPETPWSKIQPGLSSNQQSSLQARHGTITVRRNTLLLSKDSQYMIRSTKQSNLVICSVSDPTSVITTFLDEDDQPMVMNDMICLDWSNDEKTVVCSGKSKRIRVFEVSNDFRSAKMRALLVGHSWIVHGLCVAPNNQLLCSASGLWDKRCIVWDLKKALLLGEDKNVAKSFVPPHTDLVMASDISPDYSMCVSGAFDNLHKTWRFDESVDGVTHELTMKDCGGGVAKLAFSPDGTLLASGGHHCKVLLYNPKTAELVKTLDGHSAGTMDVHFSLDGRLLVSGSDGTILVHDTLNWEVVNTISVDCKKFALSPDCKRLAMANGKLMILVFNVLEGNSSDGPETSVVSRHKSSVQGMAWSPNNRFVVTASIDYEMHVFETSTWTLISTSTMWDRSYQILFSFDSSMFVTGGDDKTVGLWRTTDGEEMGRIYVGGGVGTVALAHNTKTICAGDDVGKFIHLRLENFDLGSPTVTAVYSFDRTTGKFDTSCTVWSPIDGRRFTLTQAQVDALKNAPNTNEPVPLTFGTAGDLTELLVMPTIVDNRETTLPGSAVIVMLGSEFVVCTIQRAEPNGSTLVLIGDSSKEKQQSASIKRGGLWKIVNVSSIFAGMSCLVPSDSAKGFVPGAVALSGTVKSQKRSSSSQNEDFVDICIDGTDEVVRIDPSLVVPLFQRDLAVYAPINKASAEYEAKLVACQNRDGVVEMQDGSAFSPSALFWFQVAGNIGHVLGGVVGRTVLVCTTIENQPPKMLQIGAKIEMRDRLTGCWTAGTIAGEDQEKQLILVLADGKPTSHAFWTEPGANLQLVGYCAEHSIELSGPSLESLDVTFSEGQVVLWTDENDYHWPGTITSFDQENQTWTVRTKGDDFVSDLSRFDIKPILAPNVGDEVLYAEGIARVEGVHEPAMPNALPTYDLVLEDGSKEEFTPPTEFEKLVKFTPVDKGARITGNWQSRGRWYPGKVLRVRTDNDGKQVYDVLYDDGDLEDGIPPERLKNTSVFEWAPYLQKTGASVATELVVQTSMPTLQVQQKVVFQKANVGWTLGTIMRVNTHNFSVCEDEFDGSRLLPRTTQSKDHTLFTFGNPFVQPCSALGTKIDVVMLYNNGQPEPRRLTADQLTGYGEHASEVALIGQIAWLPGDAVEAAHAGNFCAATVDRVDTSTGRALITLDGWGEKHNFWVDMSKPDKIRPVGWCEQNGREVSPPPSEETANQNKTWNWLEHLGSKRRALPEAAFDPAQVAAYKELAGKCLRKWQLATLDSVDAKSKTAQVTLLATNSPMQLSLAFVRKGLLSD